MTGGRIRIRMEAYDHLALDASAKEIVEHAKRTNAKVAGPVPLPTRVERYTVLRSPFIDKKSREQFEIRTHKRIIDIIEPNARTVEALNRLVVPAGVFVIIKALFCSETRLHGSVSFFYRLDHEPRTIRAPHRGHAGFRRSLNHGFLSSGQKSRHDPRL